MRVLRCWWQICSFWQSKICHFQPNIVINNITKKCHFLICYHRQGFELLQEDLSSTLLEKKSRKIPVGNKVYPTKRLKQTYAGRNVLIYVYIVIVLGLITYRYVDYSVRLTSVSLPNQASGRKFISIVNYDSRYPVQCDMVWLGHRVVMLCGTYHTE